jgi:DNA-binding IclR family transcriptional regulator
MMCLESNYNNRTCRRGQRKLAELCGLNQPQVSVSIKHLTAVGLVKLKQAGNYPHVAIYSLPLPPQAFNFIDLSAAVLDILRGLGRREWAVYVALRSLISFKTRQGKVSQTKLAELSRVHRSHIPLTVSHLEKAKLIQVDRQKQGKTFQYTLPAESWPCPSSTTPKNRSTVLQKPAEPLGDYSPSTKVDIFAQFR